MPDDPIPPPEPEEIDEKGSSPDGSSPDPERLREDVAAVSELTAAGVEIDGEAQIAESTWAVYGHISYDGEVIVGEYHDAVEASEVLRATAPAPYPDDDPPAT
jgi:hypothetical protein